MQFVVSKVLALDAPNLILQKNLILQGASAQIQLTEKPLSRSFEVNNKTFTEVGRLFELHKIINLGDGGNSNKIIWRKFAIDNIGSPSLKFSADVIANGTNELVMVFSGGTGFALHRIDANATAENVPEKLGGHNASFTRAPTEITNTNIMVLPPEFLIEMPSIKGVTLTKNGEDFIVSTQTAEKKHKQFRYSPGAKHWNGVDP